MKQFAILLLAAAFYNCSNEKHSDHQSDEAKPSDISAYTKGDLQKIRWIEGKWKGMYKGEPFYEIYKMINDSTLEVISYEWNGKDSSKSSKTFLYWKDGSYYLSENMRYKVISITDKAINMKRNVNATNDVLWRYNNDTSWIAELTHASGVTRYDMTKFNPWGNK